MAQLPGFNAALVVVGVLGLTLYCLRRYLSAKKCCSQVFLHGKTVIITEATTGSGKEAARDLARRGARVILACSNEEEGRRAANDIGRDARGEIAVRKLDLASFEAIRLFADQIMTSERRVDILINYAEIICSKSKTEDGFDKIFGINHLGHFLLTHLLVDKMKTSAPARIVNVSSCAHEQGKMNWDDLNLKKPGNYCPMVAYSQSKLANILFTRELARRLRGSGVNVYVLHPGAMRPNVLRHRAGILRTVASLLDYLLQFFFDLFKTSRCEAQTIIYCAVAEEIADQSGLYYSDCDVKQPSLQARDDQAAKKLWDISLKMTGIQN